MPYKDPEYQKRYYRDRTKLLYRNTMIDLRALKLLRGCADCGYDENADALQFDHLPGTEKKGRVGNSWSEMAVIDELNKCEVVCANCHCIRTSQRRRG